MAPRKQNPGQAGDELTLEEEALVRQWLEYRKVVLDGLQQSQPNSVCQVKHMPFNESPLILRITSPVPLT